MLGFLRVKVQTAQFGHVSLVFRFSVPKNGIRLFEPSIKEMQDCVIFMKERTKYTFMHNKGVLSPGRAALSKLCLTTNSPNLPF